MGGIGDLLAGAGAPLHLVPGGEVAFALSMAGTASPNLVALLIDGATLACPLSSSLT